MCTNYGWKSWLTLTQNSILLVQGIDPQRQIELDSVFSVVAAN
ncbi:hypothetical protein [Mixta theicola]|nr:hypothetical protein [Mixta theicola]